MNKKGFTLVELLAVIVILALLALLTTTSITKLVKDAKNDLSDIQIASIKASAEVWGAENLNLLPDDKECIYITLNDLKQNGLLDSYVIDPKTNTNISGDLKIKITGESTSKGKIVYKYEVAPEQVSECKYYGDVNNDKVVNAQDAIDLSYYLFHGTAKNGLSLALPSNGDIDNDGKITVDDINTLSTKLGLVTTAIPGGAGILGDANGDGVINTSPETEADDPTLYDNTIIMAHLIDLVTENEFSVINADVTLDGLIDIHDGRAITQACVGLLDKDI